MTLATRLGGSTLLSPPPPHTHPRSEKAAWSYLNWTASQQNSSFRLKEGGSGEQVDPKHLQTRRHVPGLSVPPFRTVKDCVNLAGVGQGPGIRFLPQILGEGCSLTPHSLGYALDLGLKRAPK